MGEIRGREADGGVTDQPMARRQFFRGAVATGVGVAAWSAPNIKTLGFAPAYAQVCSVPGEVTTYTSTYGKVNNATGFDGSHVLLIDYPNQPPVNFGPGISVRMAPWRGANGTNGFVFGPSVYECRVIALTFTSPGGVVENHAVSNNVPAPILKADKYRADTLGEVWRWTVTVQCVPEGTCFPPDNV